MFEVFFCYAVLFDVKLNPKNHKTNIYSKM